MDQGGGSVLVPLVNHVVCHMTRTPARPHPDSPLAATNDNSLQLNLLFSGVTEKSMARKNFLFGFVKSEVPPVCVPHKGS